MTTKPCDTCQAPTPYSPLMHHGRDLAAGLPHLCDACEAAEQRRDEEAEKQAKLDAMRAAWNATISEEYRATDTGHPKFNRTAWDALKGMPWPTKAIGLVGPPGRCKTRIMALAAKKCLAAEKSIGWARTWDIEDAHRNRDHRIHGMGAREKLKHWSRCRVLFLDDLGKSEWTPAMEAGLFRILEDRYGARLITHWSLNPQPEDEAGDLTAKQVLSAAMDPDGFAAKRNRFAAIMSRLMNETVIIPVR